MGHNSAVVWVGHSMGCGVVQFGHAGQSVDGSVVGHSTGVLVEGIGSHVGQAVLVLSKDSQVGH